MSDLIVIGYPDEQTAARVWGELARLQREDLVDLHGADPAAATWEQPAAQPGGRLSTGDGHRRRRADRRC
jgi:uncharacterized membrane protein